MAITDSVSRWFASWRARRRRRSQSEWGDALGVMLRSQRMRPKKEGKLP